MKRLLSAALFMLFMITGFAVFAQQDEGNYMDNLFITSYYTVEVFNNNRKIGFLYAGVRAKVLRSTRTWLYVEFWDGQKMVQGWIRR